MEVGAIVESVVHLGPLRIPAYRVLKAAPVILAGANQGMPSVLLATAATDKIVGVSPVGGMDVTVHPQDMPMLGPAIVCAGGPIAYGDRLTTDADGRAVVATAGQNSFGVSREYGQLNDSVRFVFAYSKA